MSGVNKFYQNKNTPNNTKNQIDCYKFSVEGFDPNLRVNLRTDTQRDDPDSMRDVVRIENVKKTMPGYSDYESAWAPVVWRPSDQQIQNDYNRSEGAQRINCAGKVLRGPQEYYPVPKRNYPMSKPEQEVWPALNKANALVEGAFQYDYNCDVGNDTVPGALEGVSYATPYDNKGTRPYARAYGNNQGSNFSYESPPQLRARDAIPGTEGFQGEYGLQYNNGYKVPAYDDDSNDNDVPFDPDLPNERPIKNRNYGNIQMFTNNALRDYAGMFGNSKQTFSDGGPDSTVQPMPSDMSLQQMPTAIPQQQMPINTPPQQTATSGLPATLDSTIIPTTAGTWTAATTRPDVYKPDTKWTNDIRDDTMDYLPFSNIPLVRYQPKNAVYDPIEKRVTFDAPSSNVYDGTPTFNGAPSTTQYHSFDPSIPDDGYDNRTGKVFPWVEEQRKKYWEERKKVPQNCILPGQSCQTNSSWPILSFGPTPLYSTTQLDNTIDNLPKTTPSMGESESIMQGAMKKPSVKPANPGSDLKSNFIAKLTNQGNKVDKFVPSNTNNYRRVSGDIEVQFNNPSMLMRNGTQQIPNPGQQYTGPGPIYKEFNGAAAGRSLLNDLEACPSGTGRGPGLQLEMPDYDLQNPRNTSSGVNNRFYGVTAEYARNQPYRYRYSKNTPYVLPRDTVGLTADAGVAAMARRRQRDIEAINRQIQNPAHNMPYLTEELDHYENWNSEAMNSNVIYPT